MHGKIGFLVRVEEGDLILTVDDEFIQTCGTGTWGPAIFQAYPGPWRRLVIDLTNCKLIQSTLFAEVLHLRDLYEPCTDEPVALRGPNRRTIAVLDAMQLTQLFDVEGVTDRH